MRMSPWMSTPMMPPVRFSAGTPVNPIVRHAVFALGILVAVGAPLRPREPELVHHRGSENLRPAGHGALRIQSRCVPMPMSSCRRPVRRTSQARIGTACCSCSARKRCRWTIRADRSGPKKRSLSSVMSGWRMKLLLPAAFGIGTIARIAAATGSMRDAGIVLLAKFCPVSGSRIAEVKTPLR